MTKALLILALYVLIMNGCSTSLFSSHSLEDVTEARADEQVSFEDSDSVFFATYPNPFTDREFLWFASFVKGPVELRVHNTISDSVIAIYRFEPQDIPLYTISLHYDTSQSVKCVLFVDGRRKCAKVYPSWTSVQMPQWKTQYTIEEH